VSPPFIEDFDVFLEVKVLIVGDRERVGMLIISKRLVSSAAGLEASFADSIKARRRDDMRRER
jgi:hypothetical protein